MDTQAQKALRVILNVSRHRETPAEERDRLVEENEQLTDALGVANSKVARLSAEVTEANSHIDTLAMQRAYWKRLFTGAMESDQQQQSTNDAQSNQINILKAKLRTRARKSGKMRFTPRATKNKKD